MASFDRRDFSGNAVPTTITGTISPTDLTINIASATGWPEGDVGPFIVTIDKGFATEEKIEVSSRTGLVLTVPPGGRGHDGTAAVGHSGGADIEHTMAARDLAEANQHIADDTLDHHGQYLTPARHGTEVHSIGYAELEAGQRWEPGDFKWSMQTVDHAGWLKMDGRNNLARAGQYAALFAVVGVTLGAGVDGTTFGIGDVSKRVIMGKAASGVGSTLGGMGGSADSVVVTHSHTVNSHSHAGATGAEAQEHTHTPGVHVHGTTPVGAGAHSLNGVGNNDVAVRLAGAVESLQFTGPTGTRTTYTNINDHGTHAHGNTGTPSANNTGGRSATHTHSVPAESPGTDSAGVAATDANLQPFIVMNGFIHV